MSIYLNNQRITPILGTTLPDQTGQSGKFLTTHGSNLSWGNAANRDINNLTALGNSHLQYVPFSINNGLVNSSGQNITLNTNAAQTSIVCQPCTLTTADGRTFVDSEIRTRDVSDVSTWANNVDYAVFKNVATNVLTTNRASRFSISPIAPSSPVNGSDWLDTSTIPANLKVYDGTNWNINNNLVWIGNFIKTNDIVTTIKNRKFNNAWNWNETPHIIETYINGTSWYRVYSDGWCEQGGRKTGASPQTITLMKPYADSNYHISGSTLQGGYNTTTAFGIVNKSSFIIYTANGGQGNNLGASWQASGYIA